MNIKLRFFASIRETLGTSEETVSVPDQVRTIGDVRHFLVARGGAWAECLAEDRTLRMAYNQVMAEPDTEISEGCEVAFFPPVTGG
ncbi:MAG: molybdopterin converting factor subunit 1 [Oxalobacteraceae bacterium]